LRLIQPSPPQKKRLDDIAEVIARLTHRLKGENFATAIREPGQQYSVLQSDREVREDLQFLVDSGYITKRFKHRNLRLDGEAAVYEVSGTPSYDDLWENGQFQKILGKALNANVPVMSYGHNEDRAMLTESFELEQHKPSSGHQEHDQYRAEIERFRQAVESAEATYSAFRAKRPTNLYTIKKIAQSLRSCVELLKEMDSDASTGVLTPVELNALNEALNAVENSTFVAPGLDALGEAIQYTRQWLAAFNVD